MTKRKVVTEKRWGLILAGKDEVCVLSDRYETRASFKDGWMSRGETVVRVTLTYEVPK